MIVQTFRHSHYLIYKTGDGVFYFDKRTFEPKRILLFNFSTYNAQSINVHAQGDDTMNLYMAFESLGNKHMRVKYILPQKKKYDTPGGDEFIWETYVQDMSLKTNGRHELIEFEDNLKGNWWSQDAFDFKNPFKDDIDLEPPITNILDVICLMKEIFWQRINPKLDLNYMPEIRIIQGLEMLLNTLTEIQSSLNPIVRTNQKEQKTLQDLMNGQFE